MRDVCFLETQPVLLYAFYRYHINGNTRKPTLWTLRNVSNRQHQPVLQLGPIWYNTGNGRRNGTSILNMNRSTKTPSLGTLYNVSIMIPETENPQEAKSVCPS